VAVVGTGRWWGFQHARVFSGRPDVELVAIVGRRASPTQARATAFGARPYIDLEEMLARERPDLVALCLPNEQHHDATRTVIRSGTPLLAEKPLVFSLEEADALLDEAARRGLFFAIDFNHRWAQPVQLATAAIRAGRLGRLSFATWRFGGEGTSLHPYANLIETQCHGFDLLEHLVGPIGSVMAEMTSDGEPGTLVHPTVSVALRFENGAVGSLVGSYETSYSYPDAQRLEVNGAAGRLVIHDTVRRFEFHPTGSELGEVWEAGYFNDLDREFHRTLDRHVDAVLGALRAGAEPPIHARSGRRALQLALSTIQSFETGERVRLVGDPVGAVP